MKKCIRLLSFQRTELLSCRACIAKDQRMEDTWKENNLFCKNIEAIPHNGLKVIGAGLGRTGTLSLKKALEILLHGQCYHGSYVIVDEGSDHTTFWRNLQLKKADMDEIKAEFKGFASTTDNPACIHYEDLLAVYPDAKVILSIRDSEGWNKSMNETLFKSLSGHPDQPFGMKLLFFLSPFWRRWSTMNDANITHYFNGDFSKKNVMDVFDRWNASVIENCPKEKLLVFNVKQGWQPLCTFLDLPIPDIPFPHINDTNSMKKIMKEMSFQGYALLATGVALVAVMVHTVRQKY